MYFTGNAQTSRELADFLNRENERLQGIEVVSVVYNSDKQMYVVIYRQK